MANTYLLSRKTNAGANDISYLKLIKYNIYTEFLSSVVKYLCLYTCSFQKTYEVCIKKVLFLSGRQCERSHTLKFIVSFIEIFEEPFYYFFPVQHLQKGEGKEFEIGFGSSYEKST